MVVSLYRQPRLVALVMTPWTSTFLEVQFRARQFALAREEAHEFAKWPWNVNAKKFYFCELARAKVDLECALSVYKKELQWNI